jgi:hypothetical protein
MEMRLDPRKAAPEVYRAMLALESAVQATGLESHLLNIERLTLDRRDELLGLHAAKGRNERAEAGGLKFGTS